MNKILVTGISFLSLAGQTFAEDKIPTSDQAKATALEWANNLKDNKLTHSSANKDIVFKIRYTEGTPRGNVTALTLIDGTSSTTIAFKGKVTKKTTVEQLRENLLYVAMDKITTPKLKVTGWSIKPLTSVSSFKEGGTIQSFKEGKLEFNIKNKCFAVSGTKLDVIVPADAPVPASAYFRITKPISFDISFSGRLPFE